MDVQVYRINSSSYQDQSFFVKEKQQLESIKGVTYITSLTQINENVPFILISNTHTKPEELSKNLLENTALWIHPNSGYDNISQEFVKQQNFPIIVGNSIRSNAVTEYILGSVFDHYCSIKNHPYWSEDRKWDRKLLRDQKVLIIGMGMIGQTLCQCLSSICSEVKVYDPYSDSPIAEKNLSEDLIKEKNIVIIAASLTSSSNKLIDSSFLKLLPSDALFINAARGEIVVEKDLIEWLKNNPSAKAYLDVFEQEPFGPGFLGDVSNVVKTSHIAGVHRDLGEDIINFEKEIIADYCEHMEQKNLNGFLEKRKAIILSESSTNFR